MNEFAPSNKLVITSIIILIMGSILAIAGFSRDLAGLGVLGSGIVGSSVVLVYRLFKAKKNREFAKVLANSQKDERLMNIYVHAGNMAFWITFAIIIGYIIYTGSKATALLLAPAIILVIYLLCAFYYMKKF